VCVGVSWLVECKSEDESFSRMGNLLKVGGGDGGGGCGSGGVSGSDLGEKYRRKLRQVSLKDGREGKTIRPQKQTWVRKSINQKK